MPRPARPHGYVLPPAIAAGNKQWTINGWIVQQHDEHCWIALGDEDRPPLFAPSFDGLRWLITAHDRYLKRRISIATATALRAERKGGSMSRHHLEGLIEELTEGDVDQRRQEAMEARLRHVDERQEQRQIAAALAELRDESVNSEIDHLLDTVWSRQRQLRPSAAA